MSVITSPDTYTTSKETTLVVGTPPSPPSGQVADGNNLGTVALVSKE